MSEKQKPPVGSGGSKVANEESKGEYTLSPLPLQEQNSFFNAKVSVFAGATGTVPTEDRPILAVLTEIQGGRYSKDISRLRNLKAQDPQKYSDEKKRLPALTLSGTFLRRRNDSLVTPSGFFTGDIDHIENLSAVRALICGDPFTAFCFVSPGGDGLKVGVKIASKVLTPEVYQRYFRAIQQHVKSRFGVALDEQRKDLCGLCFVSYDPNLYLNPKSEVFLEPKEEPKPAPAQKPATKQDNRTLNAAESYCRAALESACEEVRAASEGTRNATLNIQALKVGQLVAAGGLPASEGENGLIAAARACGLSDQEARQTFKSGFATGLKTPRDLSGVAGNNQVQTKTAAGVPVDPVEWAKPICFLEKIALPKFPSNLLPDALRGYVETVADCRQVPGDLPALLAIAVAATAGARKYRVYIGNSHTEPLNLWMVAALPPGSRKSDTFNDMAKPLYTEQSRLSALMKPAIDRARALQKLHEKRMENILHLAAKEKNPERREQLEKEYAEMGQAGVKVPAFPCLVASGDTTPEAVGVLLDEQGGRIAIMDTEGGLFSMIAGRYDGKGEANLDVWLKMHSGDELSIHRRNRPPIEVSKPAGTVAITVQPSVIKNLAERKDFKDRGLLGRFLYALPASLAGTRLYDKDKKIDQAAKSLYLEAVKRIFLQPWAKPASEGDSAPHHPLYIRGASLEIWEEFYNDIEKRQARGGDLEGITDWASKCASAIARIAGVFHLIETGGDPAQNEITVETIGRAYEIGRIHLIEHAKAAYGLMSMTSETHLARDILAWIASRGKTVFTASDYWTDNRSKAEKLDDLRPGFELLTDRGIIRELPAISTGGRKPKGRYEINPSCNVCFKCFKECLANEQNP